MKASYCKYCVLGGSQVLINNVMNFAQAGLKSQTDIIDIIQVFCKFQLESTVKNKLSVKNVWVKIKLTTFTLP
jgi:hypothetical protein